MTKTFKLPKGSSRRVEELCTKHLGDKKYHLHSSVGGEKWRIRADISGAWLDLEDSPESLLIIMQL